MTQKEWAINSTAYIDTDGYGITFHKKLREVKLVQLADKDEKIPIWWVRFEEVDDDVEIRGHLLAVPATKLYRTLDEALAAAATEFKATLLNEMQDWRVETTPKD